jgi:SPP1 gp7 family putative phage head morphogenesis protein
MNLDATKFLEDVTGRYAKPYFYAVHDLLVALITSNAPAAADARAALQKTMAETMGLSAMLGAAMTLQAAAQELAEPVHGRFAHQVGELLRFAAAPVQSIVPRVTFAEALEDIVTRVPIVVRPAAERTAQGIARAYEAGHVMAFVRAVEQTVAEEAQAYIARAFKEGLGETEAGRRLAMRANVVAARTSAWSESYARMAFRTNVNTAVTAGRFKQAQDQDIRTAVPAFRFDAVGDSDTRHNHGAADGMVLAVEHPAWAQLAPPLGYNCRCQVSHVTAYELTQQGRLRNGVVINSAVPAGAYPDPGFRH